MNLTLVDSGGGVDITMVDGIFLLKFHNQINFQSIEIGHTKFICVSIVRILNAGNFERKNAQHERKWRREGRWCHQPTPFIKFLFIGEPNFIQKV